MSFTQQKRSEENELETASGLTLLKKNLIKGWQGLGSVNKCQMDH